MITLYTMKPLLTCLLRLFHLNEMRMTKAFSPNTNIELNTSQVKKRTRPRSVFDGGSQIASIRLRNETTPLRINQIHTI